MHWWHTCEIPIPDMKFCQFVEALGCGLYKTQLFFNKSTRLSQVFMWMLFTSIIPNSFQLWQYVVAYTTHISNSIKNSGHGDLTPGHCVLGFFSSSQAHPHQNSPSPTYHASILTAPQLARMVSICGCICGNWNWLVVQLMQEYGY